MYVVLCSIFVIIKVLLSITRFSWPKRIVYTLDDNSWTSCVHTTTQWPVFLLLFFLKTVAEFWPFLEKANIWDYFLAF